MNWLFRRFLLPFAVATPISATFLLAWLLVRGGAGQHFQSWSYWFALAAVAPFVAVGLLLLLPIGLILRKPVLPRLAIAIFLAIDGAAIGGLLMLPFTETGHLLLLDLTLPAFCGAASATVWFGFKQKRVR